MARNPWKKLMANVRLVASRHGGYGHEWSAEDQKCEPRLVTITHQYLREQFNRQQSKCYWMGVVLNPDDVFRRGYPLSMSVDRLNNDEGYVPGNVVITSRFANLGRGNCDADEFSLIMEGLRERLQSPLEPFFDIK